MTADRRGGGGGGWISLLILSDVSTCWMTLKGIFVFVLINSNEIIISSNKNHFIQFHEVINGRSISSYFPYLSNNM